MGKDTVQELWNKCLKVIKDNINEQSYITWFCPIKPLKFESEILTIQVPSQFFYEWLEEHFIGLLKKAIFHTFGENVKLEYNIIVVKSDKKNNTINLQPTNRHNLSNKPLTKIMSNEETVSIKNPFIIPGLQKLKIDPQLNPNLSFDNFVQGDCNNLGFSAGYSVAKNPGKTSFNPLLIFGGVGLGKTHLANAIGIAVKKQHPEKTVLYVSSEKFTNQFIEAVRNNNHNDFVNFYQMIDVLIVDDVQFLSGKQKTQEIFFHIFNHLHQERKQIILTADKPPVEIEGMEQRVLSRFKWGLAAELLPPDLETRIAILSQKMINEGFSIPNDCLEYIAYSITTNIRELEGILISLLAHSSMNKKEVTLELTENIVDKFVKNNAQEISIDFIQKVVCDYFKIPINIMKSKTRKREIVQARQIAMYFSKKMTKSSLANIGVHCGNKDHATVLHACKTVNNLIDIDRTFRGYIEDLKRKFVFDQQ